MERGFQKGDKCQKGGKKSQILHHLDELIPKPWNRKKRLVPLCFQKIQQNLQNLRCQFRRDKFSPAWNLPKRCFLVCFFGRKGWQTTNCWLFFFGDPLGRFPIWFPANFWGLKFHNYFDSEFAYDVMRKAGVAEVLVRSMRLGCVLVDLEASNVSKKQVYKKRGHMSR